MSEDLHVTVQDVVSTFCRCSFQETARTPAVLSGMLRPVFLFLQIIDASVLQMGHGHFLANPSSSLLIGDLTIRRQDAESFGKKLTTTTTKDFKRRNGNVHN
jgi:hypothetical protein